MSDYCPPHRRAGPPGQRYRVAFCNMDAERATHSVEASQGTQAALRKIAELDAESDQLHRSKATLTSAADQLDQRRRSPAA